MASGGVNLPFYLLPNDCNIPDSCNPDPFHQRLQNDDLNLSFLLHLSIGILSIKNLLSKRNIKIYPHELLGSSEKDCIGRTRERLGLFPFYQFSEL